MRVKGVNEMLYGYGMFYEGDISVILLYDSIAFDLLELLKDYDEEDIEYINNITLWNDIKIIFKTIIKVFRRDGISRRGKSNNR